MCEDMPAMGLGGFKRISAFIVMAFIVSSWQLEKNLGTLNDECMSILAALHSGECVEASGNTKDVLQVMGGIKENLDSISEKAEL